MKNNEAKDQGIISEISENDPLGNLSENDGENVSENDLENIENFTEDSGNVEGMGVEDDSEEFVEDSENDSENDSEDVGNYSGEDSGNGLEDSENDWDEPEIDTEESDEDPLDVEEEEAIYVDAEEYVEDMGIEKELKDLLDDMGELMIESADEFKVSMCVALGGGHPSQYAAKPKLQKKLLESIKLVLKHKDFSLPTPGQTVLGILAMMTLPPISMALINKYTGRNSDKTPRYQEQPSEEDTNRVDYSHTKEFKSGRTRFNTFKSGMYRYDSKGTYISEKYADDGPSIEIQQLLNEGKTSSQIKDLLYGGKK
jgi:hypothetical protein